MPETTSWLKQHETLLLGTLVLLVVVYLGHLYFDRAAADAQTKAALAQQTLEAQVAANKELKADQDAREAKYEQLVDAVNRQNATLVSAIAARDAQLKTQQQTDANLPLDALGLRWESLLSLPPASVQKTDSGLVVNDAAARTTVSTLEEIPVLKSQVSDQQTMLGNKDSQLASLSGVVAGCQGQVVGLNTQIADKDRQCSAQVAEIKAKARISKAKWFGAGAVTAILAVMKLAL